MRPALRRPRSSTARRRALAIALAWLVALGGLVGLVGVGAPPAAGQGDGEPTTAGRGGDPTADPTVPSWAPDVQALLERRAAAVRSGDREGFLATVDPRADADFREAQERLFEGLASVPLASYELELRTEDVLDLSVAVSGHAADEVRLPAVEERHRIEGVDGVDAVGELWLTFVRRGDRWSVAADDEVADLGLRTQRRLWDFGPVTFTGGERVVVMSHPEDRDRAASLLDIAREGIERLRGTLDWEGPPKVLVALPGSTDHLEEILQTNFDLDNFVAFATSDVDRSVEAGGWRWTAPRVYAQEENLAGHDRDFQVETLHHELVHVVAFDRAGPHVPNWLHEGHADFLALGRPEPSAVPGSDGRLPLDHHFVTGGRDSILRAYRESTSAVAFLAERVGPDAPSRLFERLGSVRVEPGTWWYHLDRALADVYGGGFDEFESDWAGG